MRRPRAGVSLNVKRKMRSRARPDGLHRGCPGVGRAVGPLLAVLREEALQYLRNDAEV